MLPVDLGPRVQDPHNLVLNHPNRRRDFIALSLSLSAFPRPDLTEILK